MAQPDREQDQSLSTERPLSAFAFSSALEQEYFGSAQDTQATEIDTFQLENEVEQLTKQVQVGAAIGESNSSPLGGVSVNEALNIVQELQAQAAEFGRPVSATELVKALEQAKEASEQSVLSQLVNPGLEASEFEEPEFNLEPIELDLAFA